MVLNFYAFSCRKNMGNPLPCFYLGLGTHLVSTPEDNQVLVFQVPFHHSAKILTPASYGTNPAIAAGIENFPPHPHNNCCHEMNLSLMTTFAPRSLHASKEHTCDKHSTTSPMHLLYLIDQHSTWKPSSARSNATQKN